MIGDQQVRVKLMQLGVDLFAVQDGHASLRATTKQLKTRPFGMEEIKPFPKSPSQALWIWLLRARWASAEGLTAKLFDLLRSTLDNNYLRKKPSFDSPAKFKLEQRYCE